MGIDNSMNFMADAVGTKKMFIKEKLSRRAFYSKLSKGKSFSDAKSEGFFVDDESDYE